MKTDYHSHILPGIDDGAKDEEMSIEMLNLLKDQGVERVVATPHFYAHREISVREFLIKREKAYQSIESISPIKILLGAEVAIEHEISELPHIEELAIQGTKYILLELPYRSYEPQILAEVRNISMMYHLKVILAHVHRYVNFYTPPQLQEILRTEAYFQVNHDAFSSKKEKKFVKGLIKNGYPIVFGSDCHDLTSRKPEWNVIEKKCSKEAQDFSDSVLDQ